VRAPIRDVHAVIRADHDAVRRYEQIIAPQRNEVAVRLEDEDAVVRLPVNHVDAVTRIHRHIGDDAERVPRRQFRPALNHTVIIHDTHSVHVSNEQ
jgi:hypothetical protein